MLLAPDPAVVLPGVYAKDWKTYVHSETCTWMYIAVLFITVKTGKQPRHPLVSEWVNKVGTYKQWNIIQS